MRTRPLRLSRRRPLRVTVLTGDGLLRARLARLGSRSPLELSFAEGPGGDADAYVVPVRDLRLLGGLAVPPLPGAPLVIAYGPPELLRGAFLAGCDDYLKEPWAPDELEARLLKLAWDDEARRPAQGEYELEGRRVRLPDGREVLLSAHEAVVASLLLANRGAVVSRRALSFALWGRLPQRPSRALDMHVSALRRKLGRVSISCVRGQGYLVD